MSKVASLYAAVPGLISKLLLWATIKRVMDTQEEKRVSSIPCASLPAVEEGFLHPCASLPAVAVKAYGDNAMFGVALYMLLRCRGNWCLCKVKREVIVLKLQRFVDSWAFISTMYAHVCTCTCSWRWFMVCTTFWVHVIASKHVCVCV